MAKERAIVFDLDDTLYPLDRFRLSGFRAVSASLERDRGLSADRVFSVLVGAFVRGSRGRELQAMCARFGLPVDLVPSLVATIRQHEPRLRLPRSSARVLDELRPSWRVGILTNGLPSIQARKIAALGLEQRVNAVVFAAACGTGSGKPEPEGFRAVLTQLGATADRAVFVGNDPHADVYGASRAGFRTIHLARRGCRSNDTVVGDARVAAIADVPIVADRLVRSGEQAHVA